MSIIQRLQVLAAQQPDNLLYEWFEKTSDGDISIKHSFSYSQACNRVSALACHLLHEENLLPGDRVLLCYPPCLEFLFAFLGCILANVIPVPAYPPNPQALKATIPIFSKIKNLVNAKLVLTNKRYYRWTALNLFASWPSGLKWVATDAIVTPQTASPSEQWHNREATDTAFVQFTSGSTGDPKGVMITHRALWESFRGMTACEDARMILSHGKSAEGQAIIDHHSRETRFSVVSWLPLYHDLGLIFAALLPIFRAGSASLCSPLDFVAQPLTWLIGMSKTKATVSCAPTFAFGLVVKRWQSTPQQQRPDLNLSCVRFIPVGGEAVRAKELLEFAETFEPYGFNRRAFCPSYGGAECTVAACAEFSSDLIVSKRNPNLVSCGSNFERSGMLVAVLKRTQAPDYHSGSDFFDLDVAEDGEIGEIMVTGNALSSGYWTGNAAPEQVPQNFVPRDVLPSAVQDLSDAHPGIDSSLWFATGDLGFLEEGHLYVTGRIKEAIVVRGRNHVASDIEHTVMTSAPEIRPGCIAAVAVTNPNSTKEEALILCETRHTLLDPKAKNVMGRIRRCIGEEYGIKSSVALLKKASLPKTTSGKLQRTKAAEMWKTGSLRPIAFRTVSEQTIDNSPANHGSSRPGESQHSQLTPDTENKPGFDNTQASSERVSQPSRSSFVSGYLAFATTQLVWTSMILSAVVCIAIWAFSISFDKSLMLGSSNIPLIPLVCLFTLAITTVVSRNLIVSIYKFNLITGRRFGVTG